MLAEDKVVPECFVAFRESGPHRQAWTFVLAVRKAQSQGAWAATACTFTLAP